MKKRILTVLALTLVLPAVICATDYQQSTNIQTNLQSIPDVKVVAKWPTRPIVGLNDFELTIATADGAPIESATVTLSVEMTSMDMGVLRPKVTHQSKGTYLAKLNLSMAGPWKVTAKIELPGRGQLVRVYDLRVSSGKDGVASSGSMLGRLGRWGMQKEGSGTSWLPESSPMFMKSLPDSGPYELSVMGYLTLNENESGGKRGDDRFYSNSMLMLMGRRETGGGVLGLSLMASLDAIFNGEYGYPDLFQTGETAYGKKLTDFQHPHDLFAEIAATYSHQVSNSLNAFLYAAPVGEPALGGPVFMHRPSGMEIPEAPISHHWFDSTHIAWGVVTAGVNSDKWQIEGSLFNGHEPDEDRYTPDPVALNSASGRLTYNPSKNLSLNVSYGYLNSPESTEPGIDQHRITATAIYSQSSSSGDNLSMTAAWGRNILSGHNSDSLLIEGTWLTSSNSWFARWEHVDKDELIGVPKGTYKINKFLIGGVKDFATMDGFAFGIGAYAGFYIFPDSLKGSYGSNPLTLGVYLRIRPQRMKH